MGRYYLRKMLFLNILPGHPSLVGGDLSETVGASIRCAVKDEAPDTGKELRFCLPTLIGVQVVDCVDYSAEENATFLWHLLQNSQEGRNRGFFLRFSQYAEICLHVEQHFHYKFPEKYYTKLSTNKFLKLMEQL